MWWPSAPAFVTEWLAPWFRFLLPWFLQCAFLLTALVCYKCRRYYFLARRLFQIYSFVIPPFLDYQFQFKVKAKIMRWDKDRMGDETWNYHVRCSKRVFAGLCTLGGYFIKNGQRFALMKGLLPSCYYAALQPLFAEVPERSFTVMAKVFHDATGKSVSDVFENLDAKCLGAASLAQTYKGTLRPEHHDGRGESREVVVKIQYPEVEAHFALDIRSILFLTWYFLPDAYPATKAEAGQHLRELDLRNESENLKRVGAGMKKAGLMPDKIMVPQPFDAFTTRKTLVMDFLDGTTFEKLSRRCLKDWAVEEDKSVKAKGIAGAAAAHDEGNGDGDKAKATPSEHHSTKHNPLFHHPSKLIKAVGAKTKIVEGKVVESFSKVQKLFLGLSKAREIMDDYNTICYTMGLVAEAAGYQILVEGCVNVDPHPGNIICMDDGRVGLIDFGQCAFLDKAERRACARVVKALNENDRAATCAAMRSLPPRGLVCKHEDDAVVERFAVWAFDRIDMSMILYDENGGSKKWFNVLGFYIHHALVETPPAYAAVRRVAEMLLSATLKFGGKVMCPLSQAWAEMADSVLLVEDEEEDAPRGLRKIGSFFKKVRRKSYRNHLKIALERKRKRALGLDIIEGAIRFRISPKTKAEWQRRIKICSLKEAKGKKTSGTKTFDFDDDDEARKKKKAKKGEGADDDADAEGGDSISDDAITTEDGKDIVHLELVADD